MLCRGVARLSFACSRLPGRFASFAGQSRIFRASQACPWGLPWAGLPLSALHAVGSTSELPHAFQHLGPLLFNLALDHKHQWVAEDMPYI